MNSRKVASGDGVKHKEALSSRPRTYLTRLEVGRVMIHNPASKASCGIGSRGWDLPWHVCYLLPRDCAGKDLRHEARSGSIRRTSSTRLEVG